MPIVICLLMLLLGLCIGYSIARHLSKPIIFGKLKVDTSDPDGPYLFLELTDSVNVIQQQEYVTLKVDVSSYISQN